MKQFKNIEEFSKAFVNEDFALDPKVQVGDDTFNISDVQPLTSVTDAFIGKKPIIAYLSETSASAIVCFWTAKGNSVVPGGVILTDKSVQPSQDLMVEMNGEKITIRPDQLIGDIATVKFTSFSSPRELRGKVDTGATISSLHADSFKINGNTVTFTCQPLGPNSVTIPLKTQHAVKSPDGGTHYRPVIELNVKVNGKLLNNVLFNLNDRGNMDEPVLLGLNVLQAGKFFVDPQAAREGTDLNWAELEKLIEELEPSTEGMDPIVEIYTKMLTSNVSFRDLVRHIRSEVIKTDLE
jgi:hypothetical protein